jgi:Cdc6-like AAA superfamily ATPase
MISRIGMERIIKFPDYSEDELWEILKRMVTREEMTCAPAIASEFKAYMRHLTSTLNPGQFGNATSARNTLERATQVLASRVRDLSNPSLEDLTLLKCCDFGFFAEHSPVHE